jgi:hypothetical protein
LSSEEISVITWERLYEVANEDRVLVKLNEVVLRGFPQSSYDVDEELRQVSGSTACETAKKK